jgi:hypothetical protein
MGESLISTLHHVPRSSQPEQLTATYATPENVDPHRTSGCGSRIAGPGLLVSIYQDGISRHLLRGTDKPGTEDREGNEERHLVGLETENRP